ncbi:MAG: cytochrome c3 family protein [bacterium]
MKRVTRLRAELKLAFMATMVFAVAAVALLSRVYASPPGRPSLLLGTALLQPPPRITLRFPHKKHKGDDFKCVTCHPQAKTSTRSADLLLPTKKVCVDCHDEAAIPKGYAQKKDANKNKTCKKCHTRFGDDLVPVKTTWKKPRYRFSHRMHVQQNIQCVTCHKGVDTAGPPNGTLHIPRMSQCLSCHNKNAKAPTRCTACHERVPGGRMRIRYPEGNLKPGRSLPHLEHGPTFGREHKSAARAYKNQCMQCHQRSTCLKCHGGVLKPASIHLGNYILRHGRDARANRSKCRSCHTRQRFCTDCHNKMGFKGRSTTNPSPYLTPGIRKFHGSNWASSAIRGSAANRHATHARRNVGTCVSCHRESDCMTCHARRRKGGLGRNPHGPGFRFSRRCKTLLKKNRRACLKCHGFNDPLMTLCR